MKLVKLMKFVSDYDSKFDGESEEEAKFLAFIYDESDPVKVSINFEPLADDPLIWEFARSLLIDTIRVGVGGYADVQIRWPLSDDDKLSIRLHSPDGEARIRIDSAILVREFVERTLELVPETGEEEIATKQVEDTLERIFSTAT